MEELKYGQSLKMIVYDKQTGKITLFHKGKVNNDTSGPYAPFSLDDHDSIHPVCETLRVGSKEIHFFAEQHIIDDIAKDNIYDTIHSSIHNEDSYIWINEIIDMKGGEKYAIRRIHPNLPETEGAYLSTEITDMKGNLPYLSELESIKEKGEVLHTYFFPNRSDGRIIEKASYGKLYAPFNWIIATGYPVSDIFTHAEKLAGNTRAVMENALLVTLAFLITLFFIVILLILFLHKKNKQIIAELIRAESKKDPLTGALNRKAAEILLEDVFTKFKQEQSKALIIMFCLDDFQQVNVTYGLDIGDKALKHMISKISSSIRGTDHIVRWGSEEFLIICTDLDMAYHHHIGEKIVRTIRAISFESPTGTFNVSVSVGSAFFHQNDSDHLDVLTRAERAMRYAKKTGKDRYINADETLSSTRLETSHSVD